MATLQSINSFKEDMEVIVSSGTKNLMTNFGEKNLLGKGAYWTCYLAQRNFQGEDGGQDINKYVLKEGLLNASIDEIKMMQLNSEDFLDIDEITDTRIGIREANLLANVKHPNIARLYELNIDIETNKNTLVMEYCDSGCLMDLDEEKTNFIYNKDLLVKMKEAYMIEEEVETSKFKEEMAKIIVFQLVEALSYLHGKGIAHLDLKPDNVLFKTEEESLLCKLNDFSISRKIKKSNIISYSAGLEEFKSPERAKGEFNPFKDDVFCLGMLIFTFVTGTHKFNLENSIIEELSMNEELSLKSFLKWLMQGKQDERPKMEQVIEHPWLTS